ncbi:MAG: type II toxin-antitoxin system MqsA family antitoxin [Firmicutes bacterium]|nr:type II toxin-antitoxin system MqsA family antitoxin [[Eubacterium] siraeum]MCM1488049.1 type II toxin-antitoxin system MqsA family antitoxin [Bacillota bacterium]
MTCFYCKCEMEKSYTTYVEEIGQSLIIIRNVPCYKCSDCGEKAYTGDVIERLEEIAESLKKTLTEIAIVNYSAA